MIFLMTKMYEMYENRYDFSHFNVDLFKYQISIPNFQLVSRFRYYIELEIQIIQLVFHFQNFLSLPFCILSFLFRYNL